MRLGSVKEIKDKTETRVGLTPSCIKELVKQGHKVFIEKSAGLKSGIKDIDYRNSGAQVLDTAKEVWEKADFIVKVKEPQPKEFKYLLENLTLFTFLHLASPISKKLIETTLNSKGTFIGYETIEKEKRFPILEPMSKIAGRLAIEYGVHFLKKPYGIKTKIPENVLIIGGGVVGLSAAQTSLGLCFDTTILEKDHNRREFLEVELKAYKIKETKLKVLDSDEVNILEEFKGKDIVVGGVYIAGRKADRVITNEMLDYTEEGTVFVDVSIDQGGCFEFSRVTRLNKPFFEIKNKHGKRLLVICVPNMPAAVGATATQRLNNATRPFIEKYAEQGIEAVLQDPSFKKGVNICKGYITYKPVAEAHGLMDKYKPVDEVLSQV